MFLYSKQNFKTEVKRITGGEGVTVAYDSVGKATFEDSIDCLSKRGYMVLYGNASGPVTGFNPASLAARGSLFLTRPALFDYILDRAELVARSGDVFNWIREGRLPLAHGAFLPAIRSPRLARSARRTTHHRQGAAQAGRNLIPHHSTGSTTRTGNPTQPMRNSS